MAISSAQSKPTNKTNSGALVPPPPPIIVPSGFNMNYPMSAPVEYLSEEQLKTARQDVVTRLEAAHSDLNEKTERSEELEKRAKLFSSLIEEGVVSRKELQTAERDSKSAAQELDTAQDTAKTLENELSQIDAQLTRLSKKKSPISNKSGKSKK
ncbi:MAG: hypothetical protein K2X29_07195 [Candidatus Obscuribacterales bacterium]|nr:hypothetical protein [Candidatus Obscuribacterales bacterium]